MKVSTHPQQNVMFSAQKIPCPAEFPPARMGASV